MNNCHTLIRAVINMRLLPPAGHHWPICYLLLSPFTILKMSITFIFLDSQMCKDYSKLNTLQLEYVQPEEPEGLRKFPHEKRKKKQGEYTSHFYIVIIKASH